LGSLRAAKSASSNQPAQEIQLMQAVANKFTRPLPQAVLTSGNGAQ